MIDDRSRSETIATIQRFYRNFGPEEMRHFTTPEKDRASVEFVQAFCNHDDRVLDVGCGYGRVAIPLRSGGMAVSGVDITRTMIAAAREYARSAAIKIPLVVGNMLDLPFPFGSFERVICLWSCFVHLLYRQEQIRALEEMLRVLVDGGLAVIEVNNGEVRKVSDVVARSGRGPDGRVIDVPIAGHVNSAYVHTRQTLRSLAAECPCRASKAVFRNIGGRRRLTLWLWK